MTTTQAYPTTIAACPYCGARGALVWLGQYEDGSNHWLQWATTVTHYYACGSCSAVTSLVEIEGRSAAAVTVTAGGQWSPSPSRVEDTAHPEWERVPAIR